MPSFVRSISFTIPGMSGSPGIQVSVAENNGSLVFQVDVLDTSTSTADLRGLFFRLTDPSKLAGLAITANDGTVTDFQAANRSVIDLGNGANMNGAVSNTNAFDVGVEFGTSGIGGGDDIRTAGFTLSNTAGTLTLDDIANTLFGARLTSVGTEDGKRSDSVKLTHTAPAAPDARDDAYTIFEDGQDGLDSPASIASGIVFQVLANDTDADGDTLAITQVVGAQYGTVTIVDGDDDDDLPGDAILYVPFTDYAGPDSFTYVVTDSNGGTDFAMVDVTVVAVADVAALTYTLAAGPAPNQVVLTVTAMQTDDDASEFIDSLAFAGMPGGVTVVPNAPLDPADEPLSLTRELLITLPAEAIQFTLDLTATSKETSNGDTETAMVGVNIYGIFEDGAAGLASPASSATGVTLQLPASLAGATIVGVAGAQYGSLAIVDGDDDDDLVGDAVLYTPVTDFAGWDSFTYVTADGTIGQASVTVNAVADVPTIGYQIRAGSTVNEIIVSVTATETDDDGSEYIDRISWAVAGGLPQGVVITPGLVNPGTTPSSLVQDYTITLPFSSDTGFDLAFTAFAKERSNGDEESATTTVSIVYDHTFNDLGTTFAAVNQSMWGPGDAFTFVDDRFLGIDESWDDGINDFVIATTEGKIKAGFQSTLNLTGGRVDADAPYDLSVETHYNKTTDVLLITSAADLLAGGGFTTKGPGGSYELDFIFEFLATLKLALDFGDVIGVAEVLNITLGPVEERLDILTLDSSNIGFKLPLPAGFSINFAWPDINTTSDATNPYAASGASNDFLALNLDLDSFLTAILGLPFNPVAPSFELDIGVASVKINLELLDLDVGIGLNFLQQFDMAVSSLAGTIAFENGASQPFTFGNDILLTDASSYDDNGDDVIDFTLTLDPQATLSNSTDLGFNFLWNFDLLKISGSYEIVDIPAGSFATDPVVDLGGTIPIASVPIFDTSFALDFQAKDLVFFA